MAYILDEDGVALVADVKNFCEKEVKEQCKEYDESGEWPKEIYDKAIELGYQMLEVPEEYGGLGLPGETILAMYEEMAWADAGFAVTMAASNLALKPILIAGSEEQKQKYCDVVINGGLGAFGLTEPNAGSDPGAGKTTAVKTEMTTSLTEESASSQTLPLLTSLSLQLLQISQRVLRV